MKYLENIFFIKDIPYDWIFPYCSIAIHHGGAEITSGNNKTPLINNKKCRKFTCWNSYNHFSCLFRSTILGI